MTRAKLHAAKPWHARYSRGFFLAYLLAIIALASIVASAVGRTGRGEAQSRYNAETRTNLLNQYQLIRGRIIACGANYPGGDNGTTFRVRFPGAATSATVLSLTCPGQSGANNLWSGNGSLTLPAPPSGYTPWNFTNDATSMRISTSAVSATDVTSLGLLDRVVASIGSNASRSGATMTITLMN